MNLYIKKISFLLLSLVFVFTACESDESIVITSADPAFTLEEPGINNVFLNFGIPENPAITVSWKDELTGSSAYDVEMALDNDFSSTVNLGNVDTTSLTLSVEELNMAIRNANPSEYQNIDVFVRVSSGDVKSNVIKYVVTTYPTDVPELSSPMVNDVFVLSIATLNDIAITVEWTDAFLSSALATDVDFTVEAAASGTDFANPVIVGTVKNGTKITTTHSEFNGIALGIGIAPEEAGNIDIRVVASTTNQSGSVLNRTSEAVMVSVTPFNVSFPNLYLVGNATTAGWDPNNNNNPVFRNQDVPYAYVYTGFFKGGEFKLLETNDWQPQWGTNDGSTLANSNGGSDPGAFAVNTEGYYTYNFTTVGDSGNFSVTPYDASSAVNYTSIAIIGDATPNGWNGENDTNLNQDPNNPHLWYLNGVTLTSGGQMLIRANDDWADVWRYTGSEELYGKAVLAGGGDNIPFNAPTGSYDIWFNDLDGSYVIIAN